MQAIHQAIARLGVPANATVLEPGCGSRTISWPMPPPPCGSSASELDSISGRIARALHPGPDIRIENFRDTKLPQLDAVIGNVPFADDEAGPQRPAVQLHDYFIAKSTDALKPGGILAVVTSHFTLDKQNAAIREYLAERADFLGAIRLPSDAFKREGTAVVTDIVFLRKRGPGEEAHHADPDWLQTAPLAVEGATVAVSRYFLNHPEMVLGTWSRKNTLYGEKLQRHVQRRPGRAAAGGRGPLAEARRRRRPSPRPERAFTPPPPLKHITEGSFFIRDDRTICQSLDGLSLPVVYGGTDAHRLRLAHRQAPGRPGGPARPRPPRPAIAERGLAGGRTATRPAGNSTAPMTCLPSPTARSTRPTFGETKDGTVIRRMPNIVKFKEDPDAMLVMSLEEYDEVTGKAAKAAIMQKDVVGRKPPVTTRRKRRGRSARLPRPARRGRSALHRLALRQAQEAGRSPSWAT